MVREPHEEAMVEVVSLLISLLELGHEEFILPLHLELSISLLRFPIFKEIHDPQPVWRTSHSVMFNRYFRYEVVEELAVLAVGGCRLVSGVH